MRVLLINPNTSQSMTDRMAGIAHAVVGDEGEVIPLTATRGFPYISSRVESQVAGANVLEMIAENLEGTDAVVIAAFGDPGLMAARELFDIPVIGMAEAAIMSAAMTGDTYSVVTFSPVMRRWYLDCIRQSGLASRCAGLRTLPSHPADIGRLDAELKSGLVELSKRAIEEDGSDVVILAGAPLAGLATEIGSEIPAVVIDPLSAACAQAVCLAKLLPRSGLTRRKHKPLSKASEGLNAALATAVFQVGGSLLRDQRTRTAIPVDGGQETIP